MGVWFCMGVGEQRQHILHTGTDVIRGDTYHRPRQWGKLESHVVSSFCNSIRSNSNREAVSVGGSKINEKNM